MINGFFKSTIILFALVTLIGCGGGDSASTNNSDNTTGSGSPNNSNSTDSVNSTDEPPSTAQPTQLTASSIQSLDVLSRDVLTAPVVTSDADSITITHSNSGLAADEHYQFFLNIDNEGTTGFQFSGGGWGQAGADYIIEDGDLFESTANDSSWSWDTDVGSISETITDTSISVTINKSLLVGLTPIIRVGFLLRDSSWNATDMYPIASQMEQYSIDVAPPTDTTAPILSKNGSSRMYTLLNSNFTDPGATAIDNIDGNITSNIVVQSNLNTSQLGVYVITYSITDAAGNSSSDSRIVEVINDVPNEIVIDGLTNDWLEIPTLDQSDTTLIKVKDDQGKLYILIDASNFSLGENTQIFLDTDNNSATGFQFTGQGWTQGGADYMIENNLLSKSLNDSSSWSWDFNAGEIDYVNRSGVIEIGIPTNLLTNLGNTLKVGFVSRDTQWNIRSVLPEYGMTDYTILDSCSIAANNQECNFKDANKASKIEIDSQGIAYFLMADEKLVYRWDTRSNQALSPFKLGTVTSSDNKVTLMSLSKITNRLYFGYDSGVISKIDTASGDEQSFATVSLAVRGLDVVGDYLLAQDDSGAWATHYIFNKDGVLTDSKDWNYYSNAYAWNPILNRVYFFRDGSPSDLHFEEIDQTTGKIISEGETPYHGGYNFSAPIIVNPLGDKVLTGNGNIFNEPDLTWAGAIPEEFTDGIWLHDDLITIRANASGTILERRGNDISLFESLQFEGKPRAILKSYIDYVVITEVDNTLIFNTYNPSDDTDNDGVINTEDHFPLDPSASVDTDNDGYPDYWNTGYSDNDSSTGLVIDSYPQEAACFLPAHGDGTSCDFSSTIPDFSPDDTSIDASGIIYMLSMDNKKVYRWSLSENNYISPIFVGSNSSLNSSTPTSMTYSETHNRMYFAYVSGKITYVDLLSSRLDEKEFASLPLSVQGLAPVGEFLLAQDASGAWATHYIYDRNGVLTDSKEWNYYSTFYAWNSTLNRAYFFRDDTSPNDLHYEEIDQVTGKIISDGETPNHGDYLIKGPILISPDGSQVLLGSNDIYDASTLVWEKAIANVFEAGIWAKNGDILTLRDTVNGLHLDHYDSTGTWIREQSYDGALISIYEYQNNYYVVTKSSGMIVVTEYIAPS